jgi:hypothetical protein
MCTNNYRVTYFKLLLLQLVCDKTFTWKTYVLKSVSGVAAVRKAEDETKDNLSLKIKGMLIRSPVCLSLPL